MDWPLADDDELFDKVRGKKQEGGKRRGGADEKMREKERRRVDANLLPSSTLSFLPLSLLSPALNPRVRRDNE